MDEWPFRYDRCCDLEAVASEAVARKLEENVKTKSYECDVVVSLGTGTAEVVCNKYIRTEVSLEVQEEIFGTRLSLSSIDIYIIPGDSGTILLGRPN